VFCVGLCLCYNKATHVIRGLKAPRNHPCFIRFLATMKRRVTSFSTGQKKKKKINADKLFFNMFLRIVLLNLVVILYLGG